METIKHPDMVQRQEVSRSPTYKAQNHAPITGPDLEELRRKVKARRIDSPQALLQDSQFMEYYIRVFGGRYQVDGRANAELSWWYQEFTAEIADPACDKDREFAAAVDPFYVMVAPPVPATYPQDLAANPPAIAMPEQGVVNAPAAGQTFGLNYLLAFPGMAVGRIAAANWIGRLQSIDNAYRFITFNTGASPATLH